LGKYFFILSEAKKVPSSHCNELDEQKGENRRMINQDHYQAHNDSHQLSFSLSLSPCE
jgi:hypothetical protein